MLGYAGRNQISVCGISSVALSQVCVWGGGGGRVGPLQQTQQASEKFQGGLS